MVEYTCNESSASRTRVPGLTAGNTTESPSTITARIRLGRRLTLIRTSLEKVCVGHDQWLLVQARGSRRQKERAASRCWDYTRRVLTASREPRGRSRWLAGLATRPFVRGSTGFHQRCHSRGQPRPLPSHRHSEVLTRLSTGGFVVCRRSCMSDEVECLCGWSSSALDPLV